MFIAPEFFKLPEDYRKFIVAHEAGHIAHNTGDEFLADDYATDWCISQNMSLTNCLFAMTKVLSFPEDRPNQKAEQIARCERQFMRLMSHDATNNKNKKAMSYINENVSSELDSFGGKFKKVVQKAVNKPVVKKVIKSFPKPGVKPLVSVKKTFLKPSLKPVIKGLLMPPIMKPALPLIKIAPKLPVLNSIQTGINNIINPTSTAVQSLNDFASNNSGGGGSVGSGGGYEDYSYEDYEDDYYPEEDEELMEDEPGEDEYVDETISSEMDAFGGLFKARKERKKTKVEAKAQKKRDEGEAKKMKAQASLELAKQGIVNKGLAGLGEGVGKLKMGDKYISEDDGGGKIMGMSKPMFFGLLIGLLLLGAVAVWYFKFKK